MLKPQPTPPLEEFILKAEPHRPVPMPRLIYGTAWKGDKTAELVYLALKAGFRAIDTAAQPRHYREDLVGDGVRRAIEESIVSRSELYIQTKFSHPLIQDATVGMPYKETDTTEQQIRKSIDSSLKNFAVPGGEEPYLDCVLLHQPCTDEHGDVDVAATVAAWRVLCADVPRRIRRLGISHAGSNLLRRLARDPSVRVRPSVVQNPLSFAPRHWDSAVRGSCGDGGVAYQAFHVSTAAYPGGQLLLGDRNLLGPIVDSVGGGVGCHAALYALLLALDGGMAVLDGTTDEKHMRENVEGVKKVWARWAQEREKERFDDSVVGEADTTTFGKALAELKKSMERY